MKKIRVTFFRSYFTTVHQERRNDIFEKCFLGDSVEIANNKAMLKAKEYGWLILSFEEVDAYIENSIEFKDLIKEDYRAFLHVTDQE